MKINKLFIGLLLLVVLFVCAGCATDNGDGQADLVLVTVADDDDTMAAPDLWNSMVDFCREHDLNCTYYIAAETTDKAYFDVISDAAEDGVTLIVCPDKSMAAAVYQAQDIYPDVKFILLDSEPHAADYSDSVISDNVCCLFFREEQLGFLAGYAAVKEGLCQLGFMGDMPVPDTVAFAGGFVQGADYAACEIGVHVDVSCYYSRSLTATVEGQSVASSWYANGMDCIMSVGAVGSQVLTAAEASGAMMINKYTDYNTDSGCILTSAKKETGPAVTAVLEDFLVDGFPGGQILRLGAEANCIRLEMENGRFKIFSMTDYDDIYQALADGTVSVTRCEDEQINFQTLTSAATTVMMVK